MRNVEMLQDGASERGFVRRAFDKAGLVFSVFTVPAEIGWFVTSVATANPVGLVASSSLLAMEYKQFTEHGKPPREQSWYNPERLWDRVFGLFKSDKAAAHRALLVQGA